MAHLDAQTALLFKALGGRLLIHRCQAPPFRVGEREQTAIRDARVAGEQFGCEELGGSDAEIVGPDAYEAVLGQGASGKALVSNSGEPLVRLIVLDMPDRQGQ